MCSPEKSVSLDLFMSRIRVGRVPFLAGNYIRTDIAYMYVPKWRKAQASGLSCPGFIQLSLTRVEHSLSKHH